MRKPMLVVLSLLAGMFVFFACQKEYSIEVIKNGAEGSLQDSTGNCLEESVVGTYYGGVTPGSDTAYLQVKVNVTKTGSYIVYSDKQNGMSFSDSGYFSATGITTIKLKPIGAPILPGSFDYNVTFDSTVCYFTLAVQDSTGLGLGGNPGGGGVIGGGGTSTAGIDSFMFVSPLGTFRGEAEAAVSSIGGFNILAIQGTTGDSTFTLSMQMGSATPQPGTYTTSSYAPNAFAFTDASAAFIYKAGLALGASDAVITIVITSYDATTKELKGTFSGKAKNASGSNVDITNGSFDVTVQ